MAAIVTRNFAFFAMVAFTILEMLFIIGEYWADPGGGAALLATAGLVLTIVGVSVWAWFSPRTAQYYLWASAGVIVAVGVWWAIAPRLAMDVMEERGPLVPVAAIIAAVPVVFWGMREWLFTARAGIALLIISIAPLLAVATSPQDVERGVLTAVAIMLGPYAVGGALYLLSARLQTLPRAGARSEATRVVHESTSGSQP